MSKEDNRIPELLARISKLETELAWRANLDVWDREMYVGIQEIVDYVSGMTGISVGELRSARRGYYLSKMRHVVMYLACKHTGLTTPRIGRFLKKDHTSVLYGRDRIKNLLDKEPEIKALVDGFNRKSPE